MLDFGESHYFESLDGKSTALDNFSRRFQRAMASSVPTDVELFILIRFLFIQLYAAKDTPLPEEFRAPCDAFVQENFVQGQSVVIALDFEFFKIEQGDFPLAISSKMSTFEGIFKFLKRRDIFVDIASDDPVEVKKKKLAKLERAIQQNDKEIEQAQEILDKAARSKLENEAKYAAIKEDLENLRDISQAAINIKTRNSSSGQLTGAEIEFVADIKEHDNKAFVDWTTFMKPRVEEFKRIKADDAKNINMEKADEEDSE